MNIFQAGIIGELGRIPFLISHYELHTREEGVQPEMFSFLIEHFVGNNHEHSGNPHDSLPFHHVQVVATTAIVTHDQFRYHVLHIPTSCQSVFSSDQVALVDDAMMHSIFHPPQV